MTSVSSSSCGSTSSSPISGEYQQPPACTQCHRKVFSLESDAEFLKKIIEWRIATRSDVGGAEGARHLPALDSGYSCCHRQMFLQSYPLVLKERSGGRPARRERSGEKKDKKDGGFVGALGAAVLRALACGSRHQRRRRRVSSEDFSPQLGLKFS